MTNAALYISWLAFSIIPAVIANNKGRSGVGFFFLSILLSPLIGIIAALIAKPNVKAVETAQVNKGEAKKCPYCAEMIKTEAKVCRFCGKDVPAPLDLFTPDAK